MHQLHHFFGLSEDSFAGGISTFLSLFSSNADIAGLTDVSIAALIKYIASDVISIIFIFTLFKDTFAVALTFVERIIQFAVYMLLGPICIAFYPKLCQHLCLNFLLVEFR